MNWARATWFAIVIAVIGLIAWDIFVAVQSGNTNNTISWQVWTTSQHYPALPFAFGFLMGHLFASQRKQSGEDPKA